MRKLIMWLSAVLAFALVEVAHAETTVDDAPKMNDGRLLDGAKHATRKLEERNEKPEEPKEGQLPSCSALKKGQSAYLAHNEIGIARDWSIYPSWKAPAWPKAGKDRYEMDMTKITIIDPEARTVQLDFGNTNAYWSIRKKDGAFYEPGEDLTFGGAPCFIVVKVRYKGREIEGAKLPDELRARRIFELEPYRTAYVSTKFAYVDLQKHLWINGGAMVRDFQFEDSQGPAILVSMHEGGHCVTADVSAITHKFSPIYDLADLWKGTPGNKLESFKARFGAPVRMFNYLLCMKLIDKRGVGGQPSALSDTPQAK